MRRLAKAVGLAVIVGMVVLLLASGWGDATRLVYASVLSDPVPVGENVFHNVACTAAGTANGYPCSQAVDSSLGTEWDSNSDPRWIAFDLGVERTVVYLHIYRYEDWEGEYEVEVSVNGTDWDLLERVRTVEVGWEHVLLPAATTSRYWRLRGVGGFNQGWWSVSEIQAYDLNAGTPTVTVTPTSTVVPTVTSTPSATATPMVFPTPPTSLCGGSGNPCIVTVRLDVLDESEGGAVVGVLFLYVLIFRFVTASVRVVLMLSLLFVLGWFLLTQQSVGLVLWAVFSMLLAILTNVFRLVPGAGYD